MTYQHGQARAAQESRDPVRIEFRAKQKLAELARLEAQLDRRIAAVKSQLPPKPELPEPLYGGRAGLILATKEAEGHDPKRHTRRNRAA